MRIFARVLALSLALGLVVAVSPAAAGPTSAASPCFTLTSSVTGGFRQLSYAPWWEMPNHTFTFTVGVMTYDYTTYYECGARHTYLKMPNFDRIEIPNWTVQNPVASVTPGAWRSGADSVGPARLVLQSNIYFIAPKGSQRYFLNMQINIAGGLQINRTQAIGCYSVSNGQCWPSGEDHSFCCSWHYESQARSTLRDTPPYDCSGAVKRQDVIVS